MPISAVLIEQSKPRFHGFALRLRQIRLERLPQFIGLLRHLFGGGADRRSAFALDRGRLRQQLGIVAALLSAASFHEAREVPLSDRLGHFR